MTRIALTDGSGKWFNIDSAEKFSDTAYWDGSNNISKSAGQYNHHALYRTASGKWVLNFWSQWQGTRETYEEISDQEAAEWFAVNEYDDDDIPDDLLQIVKDHLKDLEV